MSHITFGAHAAAYGFLGIGTTLLGLATLASGGGFLRSRWTLAGPAALVLLAAAGAGLGQDQSFWLPPLILAGIWVLGHAALSPSLDRLMAALAWLRQPRAQGATLAFASATLTMALFRAGTDPLAPDVSAAVPDWAPPAERYGLRDIAEGHVTTDRGRPLHVLACTRQAPLAPPGSALSRHQHNAELLCLAPPDSECNCHGWVFLGGHHWLEDSDVELIVQDNDYQTVAEPRVGDLVLYRGIADEIRHSGLVVAVAAGGQVLVESKWGDQGVYVHVPELGYGRHVYYRSARAGHLVRGLETLAAPSQP
jgi:hypothetical protein